MWTLRGKSGEIAQIIQCKSCIRLMLQEMRFKGKSVRKRHKFRNSYFLGCKMIDIIIEIVCRRVSPPYKNMIHPFLSFPTVFFFNSSSHHSTTLGGIFLLQLNKIKTLMFIVHVSSFISITCNI